MEVGAVAGGAAASEAMFIRIHSYILHSCTLFEDSKCPEPRQTISPDDGMRPIKSYRLLLLYVRVTTNPMDTFPTAIHGPRSRKRLIPLFHSREALSLKILMQLNK